MVSTKDYHLTIDALMKDSIPPCNYRSAYTPANCYYDWGKSTQILYDCSTYLLNKNENKNELIISEEIDAL